MKIKIFPMKEILHYLNQNVIKYTILRYRYHINHDILLKQIHRTNCAMLRCGLVLLRKKQLQKSTF